jgi:hypothetical protein
MTRSIRRSGFRAGRSLLAVLSLSMACGDSAPGSPTPPPASTLAPTLASPQDDAVVSGRPSLVVNNVAAGQSISRTYDFQVADSPTALTGPDNGLLASASGIAEGANGKTGYDMTRDLPTGARYYWRARAAQGGVAGPWSSAFRFRTQAGANAPPVIQSITAPMRTEVNTDIDVNAVVQDQETNPSSLVYEWTATGGIFSSAGPGAAVRWRALNVTGPTAFELTLTVIERYTVAVDGGGQEARENRVTGKTTVHVNDSPTEFPGLAYTFLDDFIHPDRPPEYCVRNFSDSCRGKQDELNDIRTNRAMFLIDPARSSVGTGTPAFYATNGGRAVPPGQASFAEIFIPCRFGSTSLATNVFGVAVGTCQLTGVYENFQWRLCDSHFQATAGISAFLKTFRF